MSRVCSIVLSLEGLLQNGTNFDFTIFITIIQTNQLTGLGTKGNLELSMTLDKTA
jgi:hypothetical protein